MSAIDLPAQEESLHQWNLRGTASAGSTAAAEWNLPDPAENAIGQGTNPSTAGVGAKKKPAVSGELLPAERKP